MRWPRATFWPSFTRISRLWAYTLLKPLSWRMTIS
jgi:hypothetical protein